MKTMITNPSRIQWEQEPNGTYRAVVYRNTEPVYQLSMEAVLMADQDKQPKELYVYMDADGFAIEHPTATDFTMLINSTPNIAAWLHETKADLQTLQAIYPADTDTQPDNNPATSPTTRMITIGRNETNDPDLIAAQTIYERMFGTVCDALHIGLLEDVNYCTEIALLEGRRLQCLNKQAADTENTNQFSVIADVTDATEEEIRAAEQVLRDAPSIISETATLMATIRH